MSLRKAMPLLARHEGVWDGFYRYYDAAGDKIDEHRVSTAWAEYEDRDPGYDDIGQCADRR